MSHVYRVTVNRPVSVLVKADTRAKARAFVSTEIAVSRLDVTGLLAAIDNGEKIYTAGDDVVEVDDTDTAGA